MTISKHDKMKEIKDEVITLTESPLYEYRISNAYLPVIGEGSHDASILFIGEAPGENEAKTGRPFCGRSGKILDEFLNFINVKREDTYITNIVKDRPPKNRDPLPAELDLYAPFLDRQIDIIEPKVVATLGRFSMKYILERYCKIENVGSISELHGKIFEGATPYGKIKIIPLFHPAVAIYNSNSKQELLEDFKKIKELI
jgi:uracil-DNA glycosylase